MTSDASQRFDATTLWLHWITAGLVLAQFATALSLGLVAPSRIEGLLAVHRSTGLLLWAVTAARLVWRSTSMHTPSHADLGRLQLMAARGVQFALYLLLLVQPATGLVDALYRGHPFVVFGLTVPALVAKAKPVYRMARTLHEAGGWFLAALVGLHTAAALFHGLVRRDQVLQSMLPRRAWR